MFARLAGFLNISRRHHVPVRVTHVGRANRLPATTCLSRQRPAGTTIFRLGADYG